jgi:hypothetical protein
MVSLTPRRSSIWCNWHGRDCFRVNDTTDIHHRCGVIDTVEIVSAVSLPQRKWSLKAKKLGFIRPTFLSPQCHWHHEDWIFCLLKWIFWWICNHYKNGLGGFNWWKNQGQKFCSDVHLMKELQLWLYGISIFLETSLFDYGCQIKMQSNKQRLVSMYCLLLSAFVNVFT